MTSCAEGDRVKIVTRLVTEEDRKSHRYYSHLGGLEGTVVSVYSPEEVSVRIAIDSASAVTQEVQEETTRRLREKFVGSVSEEQKKLLTKEELDFEPNFVVLVAMKDLEKA
jgi:hypothetical protein